jgi:hypothetical protein
VTCARPTCNRSGRPGKNQGFCAQHYRTVAVRGYVDPAVTVERLLLLRSRGMTLEMIGQAAGLSHFGLRKIPQRTRIRALTEASILAIPIPDGLVETSAYINGLGTSRRIQALSAMGWPQHLMADELGVPQNEVSALMCRGRVTASSAAAIHGLFERWGMRPGPSALARRTARRKGWVTAAAWDDIDDPDETPNVGVQRPVPFIEKYAELKDFGLTDERIAARLGIHVRSLERTLMRHRGEAAA